MRQTPTMPLRRWWEQRTAGLAMRWEGDAGFRRSFSFFLTALTLALVAACLLTGLVMARQVAPQWFSMASGGVNPGVNAGGEATFPVPPLHPNAAPPNAAPIAVATSNAEGLAQPTPSPAPSPSPAPTIFPATVTPACPSLDAPPQMSGRGVQAGTTPTPLQGSCPAKLVISAATHPNAPVTISLTFGTLDPIGCTLNLSGATDGNGNAAITFTVPDTNCFYGAINTSGQIDVGGDTSANASFAAQA